MACFSAFCGGAEKKGRMEMVLPEAMLPVSASKAEKIELAPAEMMFAFNSLACASYPALLFRLPHADANALKAALRKALRAYPLYAGRLDAPASSMTSLAGGRVALTNAGVPFTVVQDAGATAPDLKDEMAVLRFGDFRCPKRTARGIEPLMTVTLTAFRDGTAVLALARSHVLLDGTSAWSFLDAWAKAARGEPIVGTGNVDRGALKAVMPDLAELQEIAVEIDGEPLKKSALASVMGTVAPTIITTMDILFLCGVYSLGRPRVFFSDAEVARIKEAAMPSAEGKHRHSWVSTQEALAAYLLQTIAKAILKPSSKGRGMATFLLDPRKALGFRPNEHFGNGFIVVNADCGNVLQSSLQEVAGSIHNYFAEQMTPKEQARLFRYFWGSCAHDLQMAAWQKARASSSDYDVVLSLNNQTKRNLPDFGPAGSRAPSVLTNAGPSIAVPAEGGVDIYLEWDVFGSSKAKADLALRRLRDDLPAAAPGNAVMGGA